MNCSCPVCRIEKDLICEMETPDFIRQYRDFAAARPLLAGFPTALELVQHIHSEEEVTSSSSDRFLAELLRLRKVVSSRDLACRLLLLVFIPTVHRTRGQLTAKFPSLATEDVAQNLIATLLACLDSPEFASRTSHFAFAISRKIRRSAFRWAIRETRIPLEDTGQPAARIEDLPSPQSFALTLREFLDSCERRGWLSSSDREILILSKIEGISCQELSRRNGHSPAALQHRIQRLVDRLRQLSGAPEPERLPQQLELFPE